MGLPEDGELVHALFGEAMVDMYTGQEAIARGGLQGVYDSDVRNRELEGEGIVAEVLFPDFQNSNEPPWGAAFPFPDSTPELRQAGARIFNRWLADFCAQLPGRRAGVAIVQPHDIDAAVKDVHGLREAGLASVMLPTGDFELPSYHDTRYDPLWAACVDTGLPVTFHSGGTPWEGYGSYADVGDEVRVHVVGPAAAARADPRRRLRALPGPAGRVHRAGRRLDSLDAAATRRAVRLAVRARHHRDADALAERLLGPQLLRRRVFHEPGRVRRPRPDRRRPDHVGRRLPAHRRHLAALAGRTARGVQRLHGARRSG